jgi:hypothetical protein
MKKQDYSFNLFHHILLAIAWIITTISLSIVYINVQAANNECYIDLDNNTHTCDNVSAITFVSQPNNHQTVVQINLDPALGYTKAIFDVTYGSEPTDWTINIGDSPSNDGWAGDGADQSNDAEMQIKGNTLAVYGNDYIPYYETTDDSRHILSVPKFIQAGDFARLEVCDSHLAWLSSTADDELTSPYLYALNGQNDGEGSSNYDIYAAFNRVISNSSRSGSGVSTVWITLTNDSTSCGNTPISTAPVLNPIGDQSITQGDTLFFTATAYDADGDTLGFSLADNAPSNAYIDSYTGEFSWTPTEVGYVDLTVIVTEAYGTPSTPLSDQETITITVNEPEGSFTETDNSSQWTNEGQYSTDNEWVDDTWTNDDSWQSDYDNTSSWTDDDSWQTDYDNTSSWTNDDSWQTDYDNTSSWTDDEQWQNNETDESSQWTNEGSETDEGSYSPSLDNETSDNGETIEMAEETTSDDDLNITANLGNETLEVNIDNAVPPDECTQSQATNADFNTNSEVPNNCQKSNNNGPVLNNIGNPAINITINLPEAYNQPTVPNNENLPTANLAQADVNMLNVTEEATSSNHTLTVGLLGKGRIIGNQIDCGMDCTETYLEGSPVTLIAVPEIESRFIAWMGDCSGSDPSTTITMNTTINCIAVFEQEQTFEQAQAETDQLSSSNALLKMIKIGAGHGHISTTLTGIDCGIDCEENYPNGSVVTLIATPEINSRFIGWGGDCRGTSNPMTVTIREAVICAALFDTISQHTLTINQAGMGTVTASEGLENGIDCGTDCIENYYNGDTITLTAIPNPEARFVGWVEPNCAESLIMTASINCTAIFELLPHYTVTFNTIGQGRIINTAGLACGNDCVSYLSGTAVTLTAIPDSEAQFTGWKGNCVGTDSSLSLTVTTDMTCTATFTNDIKEAKKRNPQTTLFELPALLDVFAINAQGETVNTDALFAGGISSNNSTFQLQMTQTLSDLVDIRGRIFVDSLHVGQPIEISVVVGFQSPFEGMNSPPIYFMLDDTGNALPWDGDIVNLVTFKTVKLATQRVEVPIYNGQFVAPSILNIYFGYRSAEGMVIYSPENLEVIISE